MAGVYWAIIWTAGKVGCRGRQHLSIVVLEKPAKAERFSFPPCGEIYKLAVQPAPADIGVGMNWDSGLELKQQPKLNLDNHEKTLPSFLLQLITILEGNQVGRARNFLQVIKNRVFEDYGSGFSSSSFNSLLGSCKCLILFLWIGICYKYNLFINVFEILLLFCCWAIRWLSSSSSSFTWPLLDLFYLEELFLEWFCQTVLGFNIAAMVLFSHT